MRFLIDNLFMCILFPFSALFRCFDVSMSVFASTCYRGSSMLYVWVVYLQTVIRYKIIDKWFLNEFLHIMDHHLLTLEPKLIHIFTVSICQRDTETVHYMRSGNERRRRWERERDWERANMRENWFLILNNALLTQMEFRNLLLD